VPSFFIRFFVLTKWSGALKNHPVNSIFMDRKSRHNSLTVLKPHLFYSTYLSNYYFSEILLLFVEFTHSTTESWQLFFFEFFGGKDRPWRSWWRSMGAVLPYIVEESWLCYVELLPFQITGRNSFGSHQQPSEVLPCIIFYLFTRRKLRHRWLSNLSKFIQTTGSLHPYCSANHSYSYNRWKIKSGKGLTISSNSSSPKTNKSIFPIAFLFQSNLGSFIKFNLCAPHLIDRISVTFLE